MRGLSRRARRAIVGRRRRRAGRTRAAGRSTCPDVIESVDINPFVALPQGARRHGARRPDRAAAALTHDPDGNAPLARRRRAPLKSASSLPRRHDRRWYANKTSGGYTNDTVAAVLVALAPHVAAGGAPASAQQQPTGRRAHHDQVLPVPHRRDVAATSARTRVPGRRTSTGWSGAARSGPPTRSS